MSQAYINPVRNPRISRRTIYRSINQPPKKSEQWAAAAVEAAALRDAPGQDLQFDYQEDLQVQTLGDLQDQAKDEGRPWRQDRIVPSPNQDQKYQGQPELHLRRRPYHQASLDQRNEATSTS